MERERRLRDQLVELLRGGNAHMPFTEAVADFPESHLNTRPPNVDYTFWHLLEHLRLTQADILNYLTNADYMSWSGRGSTGHLRMPSLTSGIGTTAWRPFSAIWRPSSPSSPTRPPISSPRCQATTSTRFCEKP